MKTFLKVVAWTGLGLMTFGAILAFIESWALVTAEPGEIGLNFLHIKAVLFGIPGLVFILVGGLVSRPRYFWLGCIIVGSFYIISFFEFYIEWPHRIRDDQADFLLMELGLSLLPGLAAIIEGIGLKLSEAKGTVLGSQEGRSPS